MPQILSRRDVCPPDGFAYTHAETGHKSTAMDHYSWMERVREHRKANGLAPITQTQAEDQLCRLLPPEWCKGDDPNRPFIEPRMSLNDVWDAMKVFAKFALGGFRFVDQAEATRRARICVGCYANMNVSGCGACHQLAGVISGELAQRSTPHDAALRVCGVCRCMNRAQVHIPMDALEAKDSPDKQALYPSFCWLRVGGENYLPSVA